MPKAGSKEIPTLAPRPFEDGSGWYVQAKWVGHETERLGRFDTFSEARLWIELEAAVYFVLRELR